MGENAKATTYANAQKVGMEIIVKSGGYRDQFVRSRAGMDRVYQTQLANAKKAGVASFVIQGISAEGTLPSCREDKAKDFGLRLEICNL